MSSFHFTIHRLQTKATFVCLIKSCVMLLNEFLTLSRCCSCARVLFGTPGQLWAGARALYSYQSDRGTCAWSGCAHSWAVENDEEAVRSECMTISAVPHHDSQRADCCWRCWVGKNKPQEHTEALRVIPAPSQVRYKMSFYWAILCYLWRHMPYGSGFRFAWY